MSAITVMFDGAHDQQKADAHFRGELFAPQELVGVVTEGDLRVGHQHLITDELELLQEPVGGEDQEPW